VDACNGVQEELLRVYGMIKPVPGQQHPLNLRVFKVKESNAVFPLGSDDPIETLMHQKPAKWKWERSPDEI
jgi:hypothetical protein